MIKFSHIFNKGTVFVKCPDNEEEERQLDALVREVNMICGMTKKTGLWIVAEFRVGLKKVVATSLEDKVEINDNDIATLQAKVKAAMVKKGEGKADV